ncbi:MAG: hypothetical protein ABIF82_03505 [Planctomycetota bacterium]
MTIHYAVQGVLFSIEVDWALDDDVADTVMPTCVLPGPICRATRFVVRRRHGSFSVSRAGRRLWSAASEAELIPWLESEIVNWLLKKLQRFVQLHAAAIERRGRAVLIAGPPDSGKTSLACALGLLGWGVMSDEVALIEPRAPAVLSFPRAMLVKAGTVRRLSSLRRFPRRRVLLEGGLESVRYVNITALCGNVTNRARVSTIAFPEWSRTSSVEPMGEREALERLVQTSLNAARRPKRTVDTCIGLVRNSKLLRVRIGKLCDAARALSDAMGAER